MMENTNGQQDSARNIRAFREWVAGKTDEDFRRLVYRGQLSRRDIYTACEFSRSVLGQNPTIKSELDSLEEDLRNRGILPPLVPPAPPFAASPPKQAPKSTDKVDPIVQKDQRIKMLEEHLIASQNEAKDLADENKQLKKQVDELKNRLTCRDDHFLETGRMAR